MENRRGEGTNENEKVFARNKRIINDTKEWKLLKLIIKGDHLKLEGFKKLETIEIGKETVKKLIKIEFTNLPNLKIVKFNLGFGDSGEILSENPEGLTIKLDRLPELGVVLINHCGLKNIEISFCPNIVDLRVGNNLLENLDFLDGLSKDKLKVLSIHSNNFGNQDLSILSKFTNLKELFINNEDKAKKNGSFYGSLESLKNLNKLQYLDISNTNIDSGWEYLSEDDVRKNMVSFSCSPDQKEKINKSENLKINLGNYLVSTISSKNKYDFTFSKEKSWEDVNSDFSEGKLKEEWKEGEFTPQETKEWIRVGLQTDDAGLAKYLKKKNILAEHWKSPFNEESKIESIRNYNVAKFEKWKEKNAQVWLDKEYPKNDKCLGEFDKENKDKTREEIKELDIGDKGLEGELNLEGFEKLQYLICRNNYLTEINLNDCLELKIIDCQNNKLGKLIFDDENTKKIKLKEFHGSNNRFANLKNITNKLDVDSLTHFNVIDNKISDIEVSEFGKFTKLEILFISNTNKEESEKNNFSGSLEDLGVLGELLEIDISNTEIKITKDFLDRVKEEELLENLENIYCDDNQIEVVSKNNSLKGYYNKGKNFFDVKAFKQKKLGDAEIVKIIKLPLLSDKKVRYSVDRIDENYDIKKINYERKEFIYPLEAKFEWGVSGNSLQLSKLPLRLCDTKTNNDKDFKIKKRTECEASAKNYAILSYSWGGKPDESLAWSTKNAQTRLSLGGKKSLKKAVATLKILNSYHGLRMKKKEINYLWMDQLCVDQNSIEEKSHEIPNMREYYGNSSVTLIPINTNIGEDVIRKLSKSFEKEKKGEDIFIYPNKIIENSLPILEKIIGSEWFSRSWTFQEGFLSKQTIFMFDDFLIDGRFMALIWKLRQVSEINYDECKEIKELCGEKVATPVGWTYYYAKDEKNKVKEGYNLRDNVSLKLNEALQAVKNRQRSIALDGIYSIIGLLPYSKGIEVDYEKRSESVLKKIMITAVKNGYGEPLAWHGASSRNPGSCWLTEVNSISGSSSITGVINISYKSPEDKKNEFTNFITDEGLKLRALEYIISDIEKSSGVYKLEREETVEGGLWNKKIWVRVGDEKESREIKLTISGTREGVEALGKGRVLLVPNKKEWNSNVHFAILALKVRNDYVENKLNEQTEKKANIRHRIDLVRIEEGYEDLVKNDEKKESKAKEKEFIIGFDNQKNIEQYQTQIEVPAKN